MSLPMADNLQEALFRNDKLVEKGNEFLQEKRIRSFNSPGALLFSDSLQQKRIDRWNAFWTDSKKKDFLYRFDQKARQTGFNKAPSAVSMILSTGPIPSLNPMISTS